MAKTNAERVAEHGQRLADSGGKRTQIDFTKQGVRDLEKIRRVRKLSSMSDVVNLALSEFAKIVVGSE